MRDDTSFALCAAAKAFQSWLWHSVPKTHPDASTGFSGGTNRHTHMKPQLRGTSPYAAKDQAKSDRATCFIGRGSPASSTHRYMLAWGELANKGSYSPEDIVFISAEGNRHGRIPASMVEIRRACQGHARIITDIPADRNRTYNIGEREVATALLINDYKEVRPGQWIPQ